jgi:hypothetical protein
VNLGVASHIIAASPGGPRFDSRLSAAERASVRNAIWLCQTCAKLIDSDEDRYSLGKLAEWKSDAETAAARALEQRRAPASESEGVFIEAERLMADLIDAMRNDVRADPTELIREVVILPSRGVIFGFVKPSFYYIETEHPGLRLMLDWLEEMGLIIDITPGNAPVYRLTEAFARWLRGPIR